MKHRAAAILAALSVVATGALVATPADRPAPAAVAAPAAVEGVGAAALTPATSVTSPAPRHSGPALRLGDASAPGKTTAVGTGALGDVIDAVTAGEALPDELAAQVHLDGTRLRVEVVHDDEAAARAAIAAVGGRDVTEVTGQMLVADVPAGRIERLQQASAVEAVSLPTLLSPPPGLGTTVPVPLFSGDLGGDVTSTTVMDRWHSAGFIGTGVAVGIVDYFHGGAWDDAEARGEVPSPAGTFCQDNGGTCDLFTDPSLTDVHGVAVAEAIHDMAPGATIYLATVITNEDLKAAIDYFAANDVKILSRSLGGFFDGPGDGTGVSADLVDYAVSLGMTWFNAAGNSGASAMPVGDGTKEWRGGYWRGTWRDVNNDRWMEFAHYEIDPSTGKKTGKITYFDTMFIRCSPYFRLRWSDWSASVPSDYDIYRINSDGTVMAPGYSPNTQAAKGDAPIELQNGSDSYFRCSANEWIEVAIFRDASGSGVSKDVLELQGNFGDIYGTASSPYSAAAAFNDSKNPGMAAVGAVDPVAGIAIATYSSQGPTNDGRIKPALSAGSNFTSRAYTYTGDGGRFNGTSAATPVVAGAAAVVLGRYGAMTPAQLVTRLRTSHVIDRGSAGADNVFGSGELAMTPKKFASTAAPKITGTRAVGSTLKLVKPTWSPNASFTYRWYRGSKPISGATGTSYKLTKADGGQRIRVAVTGGRKMYASVIKYSSYTAPIAKLFTKAPTPKISGVAKVGRTLTASVGTWSPKPSKFTYQWKANGKAIKGATKKSYKITSSRAGARITVTVTAVKSGYKSTAKTSANTAKVTR